MTFRWAPRTDAEMSATFAPLNGFLLDSGEASCARTAATAASTLTSGDLKLAYFTAVKTETVASVRVIGHSTAAAPTPTLARFGLYAVDDAGALSLVASTVNDTALFAATFTVYTRAFAVPYLKVAGRRYAFGALVVTAAAAPTVYGTAVGRSSELAVSPRTCGVVTAQADLPATITSVAVDTDTKSIYGALIP